MADMDQRLENGAAALALLGIVAVVVAFVAIIAYEIYRQPVLAAQTVGGLIGLAVGIIIAVYVLGWLTTDLPEYAERWR